MKKKGPPTLDKVLILRLGFPNDSIYICKLLLDLMLKVVVVILFYLLCLLMTIDTGLFVYPSLSRMLLMMVVVLSLSILSVSFLLVKREKTILSFPIVFVACWLLYTLSHGCYIGETYRTLYLSVCLIGITTIANLIKTELLSEQHLSNGIIGIAIVHIMYMAIQSMGLVTLGNAFFHITGSNENPTTTALFLTGSISFIISRLRTEKHQVYYIFLLILLLLCIFSLRCRTAYIGVIVIFCYYILENRYIRIHVLQLFSKYKFLCAASIIAIIMAGAYKMYTMKQDSADGRVLIWKLSAKMITEKPYGYGYGMFEKYYNLRQADYFSDFGGTRQERDNATHVSMAFNDYLEHGVEGGVGGATFLIGFYVLFTLLSVRHRLRDITPVLLSFSVMSLTNFVIQGIQPWMLVCICSGIILSKDIRTKFNVFNLRCSVLYVLTIFILAAMTAKVSCLIYSQHKLYEIVSRMQERHAVDDILFDEIAESISTSEAFCLYRSKNSINCGNYVEAEKYLNKALDYSSSPEKFFQKYRLCMKINSYLVGIHALSCISNMNPCHLHPKLLLMKYYDSHNDTTKAVLYAKDIISTKVKNPSNKSQSIQYEAYQYLRSH